MTPWSLRWRGDHARPHRRHRADRDQPGDRPVRTTVFACRSTTRPRRPSVWRATCRPGDVADDETDAPDVVVVAAPPDVAARVVVAALDRWPDAVVTDVASVKESVLRVVLDSGADSSRYVGSHPMAGRERSGAAAARADLFDGRAWVVVPHEALHRRGGSPGARARARRGLGRPRHAGARARRGRRGRVARAAARREHRRRVSARAARVRRGARRDRGCAT